MPDLKDVIEQAFTAHREGNLVLAEQIYDQTLSQLHKPDVNILFGYGSLLVQKEKFGLGIALLQTAIGLCDSHPGIWTNLAVAYKYTGKDEQALAAYETAYKIDPNSVEVLAGLSGFYINRGEAKRAEQLSRDALALGEHPAAHMHLGLALLEQQKFAEAWPHYEHRWDTHENKKNKRSYFSPKWDGKPTSRLVIHGEQGLGDEIMFMSLFRKAQALCDEVVIECADRLVPVFKESFGVPCYPTEAFLKSREQHESAHVAMGSLPYLLGLPDGKPYLKRPQVHNIGKPIIGIAWRGGTLRTNHKVRSLTLYDFKPIMDAVDAQFISVQYGGDEVDVEAKAAGLVIGPRDFVSLQHRIGVCDMVISVCQTAVHQAGAMGVPCIVLAPHKAAWRYCGNGNMLPWYESVQIVRQSENEDWAEVIQTVTDQLRRQYALAA